MTNNKMKIAIAISLGAKWVKVFPTSGRRMLSFFHDDDPNHPLADMTEQIGLVDVPDYPNDLNACHLMELSLPFKGDYVNQLSQVVAMENSKEGATSIPTCMATAAQRCEAYLRVKNLWKE